MAGSRSTNQNRGLGDTISKRFTYPSTLSTGAGVVFPVTSYTTSSVQAIPATEWSSFAARYQQYRVRGMRLLAKARFPVNTSTIGHSIVYIADYIGSAIPGSASQVLSDEGVKVHASCTDWSYGVSWSRNPNAKLWNPTSTSIPVANQFGIVFASSAAAALTTATTYYDFVVEWDVEFRGSQ
jgi:hypothetical protein